MKIYSLDRTKPLQIFDDPKLLDGLESIESELLLTCSRHEIFIVQLLLVTQQEEESVTISCGTLLDAENTFTQRVTCYNTEGTDKWGVPFTRGLTLHRGTIQPLYFGVRLDEITAPCVRAVIEIRGAQTRRLELKLTLTDEIVENHGFSDLWRLSRLEWLNSNLFLDDCTSGDYPPILAEGRTLRFQGRTLTLAESGLPESVTSFFDEGGRLCAQRQASLLDSPVCFSFGEEMAYRPLSIEKTGANVRLTAAGEGETLSVETRADVKYEGALYYTVRVRAKQDVTLPDVSLCIPVTEQSARYSNGLGKKGGAFEDIRFRWNEAHQDCVYVGSVNCGLRVKWKAEQYVRPLVNIYYHAQPLVRPTETWENHGAGEITVLRDAAGGARITARTGVFSMKKGEERVFSFELHLLPFRPVDYKKHYAVRYYHTQYFNKEGRDINPEKLVREAKKNHLTHIIVHHGSMLHPFINYPFIEVERMRRLVELAHHEGIGVKYYYTSREHSNHMAEVFAYKALGGEIILRKKAVGFPWQEGISPWLTKYFGDMIVPAWRVLFRHGKYKNDHDVSFIVRPDSRLDNYYIEGLRFLTEEIGLDGIYIDDTALDRTTLERARKVLDRKNGLIDMHMWNHEEDRAGDISCMNLYTEIFPFLDSLWIGEGYPYDKLSPDYLLTEVSGLPYGLTSEMLENGGNPWIGMLYAMNNRYGWDVRSAGRIYRLWDAFGIEEAEMRGYWHSGNPVETGNPQVLATVYIRKNKALVCLCNFGKKKEPFRLEIDEKKLGFHPARAIRPAIQGLQRGKQVDYRGEFQCRAKAGLILELSAE